MHAAGVFGLSKSADNPNFWALQRASILEALPQVAAPGCPYAMRTNGQISRVYFVSGYLGSRNGLHPANALSQDRSTMILHSVGLGCRNTSSQFEREAQDPQREERAVMFER